MHNLSFEVYIQNFKLYDGYYFVTNIFHIDTLPSSLIDSNVSPIRTYQKNEELGYSPWLTALRG
jgi:hypothetical protein